jgi:hypothetical protein
VADLDVSVGIDTASAEEGLRRLSNVFHREIRAIDRSKAKAKIGADITKLDKQIAKAKRELLELEKLKADPEVDLDTKEFNAEVAAVKMRLKELAQKKIDLNVDSSSLKDANRQATLSAKRQEAMAKQTEKLNRAKERLRRTTTKETNDFFRQRAELGKLRAQYNKLANDAAYIERKTGRPGGIFHTEKERLGLERLRGEMGHVEHRIKSLGGTIDDITPDLEDNQSVLRRWGESLAGVRLHMGFFSASLKQTAVGLVALGPIITGLLGSATSLIGVLGTGISGAAVVGSAGLAGLIATAIGVSSAIKPTLTDIGLATKAAEAYHKAVLKYGKGDEHVAEAQEHLANTLKGISPRAREAILSFSDLKEKWRELTKPVRHTVFESFGESVKTAQALLPMFADETVKTVNVLGSVWDRWMAKLRSDSARSGISEIMTNFRHSLPSFLGGLESIGEIIGRITVSASKLLPSLGKGFRTWADDLDRSVGSGRKLDGDVERLVNHMRDLGHLAQATGRVVVALFNTSADSGDGLVKTLTDLMNGWADWMNSVEGQRSLRKFFSEASEETRQLFKVLGRLLEFMFRLGRATAPMSEGFLEVLNLIGTVVKTASDFDPLIGVLREAGKLAAAIWAVNRVRAFITAVSEATRVLAGYAVASGAAGTAGTAGVAGTAGRTGKVVAAGEGAIAGTAAASGAAAGRGIVGGLTKAVKIAGPAAMLLTGIELAESVMDAFADRAKQRSDDIFEALEGAENTPGILGGVHIGKDSLLNKIIPDGEAEAAKNVKTQLEQIRDERTRISAQTEKSLRLQLRELDISEDAKRSAKEMFALTRLGRKLDIRVSGAMDPQQLSRLLHGYQLLRSGALASLADIGKVTQQNAAIIRSQLPRGSDEARKKLAENFKSAAQSIKRAMEDGTVSVKQGTARMKELLRNARLLEGRDPLGLAKGFADSWKSAGTINKRNRDRVIEELRKMPPQARQEAFRMMMQYGRGLVRGGKIPKEALEEFKSKALVEIEGIGSGFQSLNGIVFNALKAIGDNLSEMLRNIGGKPPKFNLKKALNSLPELPPLPTTKGQQAGGFTVPGNGPGDHVPRVLPEGSFVMNREASSFYGLNGGGSVLTMLEPRETVFMPHEVRQIGPGRLQAMNDSVPRRAKGGPIGKMPGGLGPEPQIAGPSGSLLDIGRLSVSKAYDAAKAFYDKQSAKFGGLGGVGGPIPSGGGSAFPSGPYASDLGAAYALAQSMGLTITATTGGSHVANSWHYVGRAFDASNGTGTPQERAYALAAASRWGSHILELFYDPLGWYIKNGQKITGSIGGHSDHVHTAMELGGLVMQQLASGGFIDASSSQEGVAMSIAQKLLGYGLNYKGAAGIIGNAWRESLWDPSSEGTGGGGLWGFTAGAISLANVKAAAQRAGVPWDSIPFQTDFMWNGPVPGSPLKGALNGQSSAAAAAEFFSNEWEHPGIKAMADRKNGAREAMRLMVEGNLKPGEIGEGGAKGIPKQVKATYNTYRVTPGGDFIAQQHKNMPVAVEIPDFGPLPEGEENIKRELRKCEKELLPMYRAAYKQTKRKDVKAKLKESLAKIEARIRELRAAMRDERAKKARKKFTKRLQGQLGRITGWEPKIEGAQHEYEELNQTAGQVVTFEPEQTGEITHDWLEKQFEPYIEHQERPAFEAVLGSENKWRNTILSGQEAARQIEKLWEFQIGWPDSGKKPWLENPDLHWPERPKTGSTGLANWIYKLYDSVSNIRHFADSHSQDWWQSHPNARERRDRELGEIKDYFEPALTKAKFERSSLTGVLGEGREAFDWFKGSGNYEQNMEEVQGIHWPDQHEKLPGLPGEPVPGMFGGAIWDTQETIRGLGIKIREAKEGLEDNGLTDRSGELQAFSDAIMSLLEGRPFISLNLSSANEPFMGSFARGGVALVGERGPELAHLPDGTRIHTAAETERMLEPNVVVDLARYLPPGYLSGLAPEGQRAGKVVHVDKIEQNFATSPPDPHTWAKQNQFELGAL